MARPTTFVVEVEFTAGTWTDVSAWLHYGDELTITRGRTTVMDTAQIGTCAFSLIGDDGRFTPGYNGSPYFPNVVPNKRVRVTVSGSQRFVGYIDKWEPTFPDAGANRVVVNVTATDRGRLMARRALASTYVEQVRYINPNASVWITDEAGTKYGDILGNRSQATLVKPKNIVTTVSGGEQVPYGDGSVKLGTTKIPNSGENVASAVIRPAISLTATNWSLAWWQQPTFVNNQVGGPINFAGTSTDAPLSFFDPAPTDYGVYLNAYAPGFADGELKLWHTSAGIDDLTPGASTPYTFVAGRWYFFALVASATTLTLYINGVAVMSPTMTSPTTPKYRPGVGGFIDTRNADIYCNAAGSVTDITYATSAFTAAQVSDLYAAGALGFNGDTASSRALRLMWLGGISDYWIDLGDDVRVGPLDTGGRDVITLGQELAEAASGIWYTDGAGKVTWHNSRGRRATLTPAATFANESDTSGDGFALPIEESNVYNVVTVRSAGGGSYTAEDAAAVAEIGLIALEVDLNLYSGDEARDRAGWWLATFGTPRPRIASVEVDLLTSSTAGVYATAHALDLDSRIRITGLPTLGPGSQVDAFVEGWTETYGIDTARMRFDCSPADAPAPFMIADNTAPYAAAYDLITRLDCDGSQVVATAVNASATAIVAQVPVVTFTTTDVPFDIEVDGEILSVTAVTAAANRTNLVTNPSFEVNTTGWSPSGGVSFAQSSARAVYGTQSGLITWPTAGSGAVGVSTAFATVVGQTYTVSLWGWAPTGSPGLYIFISGIAGGTTMATKNAWTRFSLTFTATATTSTMFVINSGAATAGQTGYIDGVLVENASTVNGYFDGAQSGALWTGTAHASTSTQRAQTLTVSRGQYGTNAVAHAQGAVIDIARDPRLSF